MIGGQGSGGAVYSRRGMVLLANTTVVSNTATGGVSGAYGLNQSYKGGDSRGAGICAEDSSLIAIDSAFSGNVAVGGSQAPFFVFTGWFGSARGGAICFTNGSTTITRCAFTTNSALTYPTRTASSDAAGGAIYSHGPLTVSESSLVGNVVSS